MLTPDLARNLLTSLMHVNSDLVNPTKLHPYAEIGARIASRRRELGRLRGERITQQRLAALVGVHTATVTAWEIGKQWPEGENLLRLAEQLDVPTSFLVGEVGAAEETAEQVLAPDLPDVSFLKPKARAIYDAAVGSYLTRRWPAPIIERAAWDLTNYIRGANSLRSEGTGRPELTEEEQCMVLERAREHVERAYGPSGVVRRF